MDEARSEEASERSQQQECILSGEVHLRHRLRKSSFSLEKSDIPEKSSFSQKQIEITNTSLRQR